MDITPDTRTAEQILAQLRLKLLDWEGRRVADVERYRREGTTSLGSLSDAQMMLHVIRDVFDVIGR